MNRWVLRVAAYAGLMTDEYPPFRFDSGPDDPGAAHRLAVPPGEAPRRTGRSCSPPSTVAPWTTGRVLALAFGTLAFLVAMGFGVGGATLALADSQLRDSDGFLMSGDQPVATQSYAIVSEDMEIHSDVSYIPEALLGDAKVTASNDLDAPVFIGVAETSDVEAYLAGVPHAVVSDMPMNGNLGDPNYKNVPGDGVPGVLPTQADIWVAQSAGTGTQEITWPIEAGSWTVVVMDPTGGPGVFADVEAGVTVPGISWVIGIMLSIAAVILIIAVALLLVAFRSKPAAPLPRPPPAAPPAAPQAPTG